MSRPRPPPREVHHTAPTDWLRPEVCPLVVDARGGEGYPSAGSGRCARHRDRDAGSGDSKERCSMLDTSVDALKQRLVEGLQVCTGEGVLNGSGHLSARIPDTDTFLINPRFAGVLARVEDICTVDLGGKRIAGAGPIPSESAIHAAVYAARPDVGSVLHCHPRYSILVGLLDTGLIPFNRE